MARMKTYVYNDYKNRVCHVVRVHKLDLLLTQVDKILQKMTKVKGQQCGCQITFRGKPKRRHKVFPVDNSIIHTDQYTINVTSNMTGSML